MTFLGTEIAGAGSKAASADLTKVFPQEGLPEVAGFFQHKAGREWDRNQAQGGKINKK